MLPCEWVIDLSGEYGFDCHLLVLVNGLQVVADTVPTHGVEQVVDLGRVGTAAQDDHLSLRVVDVWDAVEDQLDVVDLSLDEILHVQVGADRATERLLVVVKRLELYRRREQAPQVDRVGVVTDRRLVQLQEEAVLRSIVDKHLDDWARVIVRVDDLTIVEVPRIQPQVANDVMHFEKEGMQGQRE
ncbi:unnamed protein product [Sphagnum jensenii]|uniref:Uncharacterized protein n=1 Tax=Sphagnum jensenii TaxID=128206 RepID=A0ABP1B431_9BRYO